MSKKNNAKKAGKKTGGKGEVYLDPELKVLMQFVDGRQFSSVERFAKEILSCRKNQPLAKKALTFAYIGLGRYEEALPVLEDALFRTPGDAELYNNRGIVLSELMRWDEAIADFSAALKIVPREAEILKNLGLSYARMHEWDLAIPYLLQAIEHHPDDYVDAIEVLASVLSNSGRVEEAWVCYRELWAGNPDPDYLFDLVSTALRRCDWEGLGENLVTLRESSNAYLKLTGNPFVSLFLPGVSALEQRIIAENHALNAIPSVFLQKSEMVSSEGVRELRRIRIGYLSADYREHPVGYVLPEVIESHDRDVVEVFGYSIGVNDNSDIRQRLIKSFDHFVDLYRSSVGDAAARIRADQIDILVDLHGWTAAGRPEILALRPAPIQATWLGYAGTLGHEKLADYLIGDPIVTPLSHEACYAEHLALMPDCYLPSDTLHDFTLPLGRSAVGLPEAGFIFCSLNNSYKFNPGLFDAWARILLRAENSYLWLPNHASARGERLLKEFAARGVDESRVIFASRVKSRSEHLGRLQFADLALDTFPYNSHSTGVDALLAGVPLVALLGDTFPGRVGGSLLHAARMPELCANSVDEYVELALTLHADSQRLATLKAGLVNGRSTLYLFDMKRFASNLERLYAEMLANHRSGQHKAIVLKPVVI